MPAQFRDYYETLGVSKSATADEIKSAFRKLARKHHPDMAKDKKAAEEKFKEINEAYEVLGDPENRKKYDDLGPGWSQAGGPQPQWPPGGRGASHEGGFGDGGTEFHFGGTGFSDFFEQVFGGRRGRGGRGGGFSFDQEDMPQRGQDVEADILVTLEEAFNGSTRSISFRKGDSGKVETYTVKIPKGIREGQRIRLSGQGGTGAGGAKAGDLFLRVKIQKHPDFDVSESDLLYDLEISAYQAVLGCDAEIPTLEGRAKLKVPAGSQNGRKFRLPGRGLPEAGGKRGDFYAVLNVLVPVAPEEKELELWRQIAALHG